MNMIGGNISAYAQEVANWLVSASAAQRSEYAGLEENLASSQAQLDTALGEYSSVTAYAREIASRALVKRYGSADNVDDLIIRTRYVFQESGRSFIQEDELSMTDALLKGSHELHLRPQITLVHDGQQESNPGWLMELLNQDVRTQYGARYREVYQRPAVLTGMKNVLRDKLLLSAFGARLQGHVNEFNLQRIRRAVAGDANFTVGTLRLLAHTRPFKDLLVIGDRSGDINDWLLYAPDSPEGQDWYTKPTFRVLSLNISGWLAAEPVPVGQTREPQANDAGCDYLSWQCHAQDRASISAYLKAVPLKPSNWSGVTLVPSSYHGENVLDSAVFNDRTWRISQEESHTPYGYRSAPASQRQQFTRLNTELKALRTIQTREAALVDHERACFDLIKQEVEKVLLSRGERVSVNPDRIQIEIDEQQSMTLTQLIVREVHFYASTVGQPKYPRFTLLAGHPAMNKLDIRDIASWSRTLRSGEKYIDSLKKIDLNNADPAGRLKRIVHLGILQRSMKVAIFQEVFNGRLPGYQFDELIKVINLYNENDPRKIAVGDDSWIDIKFSALHKFYIESREVVGVYVFALKFPEGDKFFLFTPDAPDGREIRLVSDFVASVKAHGLGDYFHYRVYEKYQSQVGSYLASLEQISNFTRQPVQYRFSRVQNFGECYESGLLKIIDDVDGKTESLNEIISRIVWETVSLAASAIAIVYAPVGVAMSVVMLGKNMVEGVEAYSDGNRSKAFGHFTNALIELASLGSAGLGKSAVTPVQKTLIGLVGDARDIEKLVCAAIGQPTLEDRSLEIIREILADGVRNSSKTILV